MKVFFEEFGMIIVVSVLAFGMIEFSGGFKDEIGETITSQWTSMVTEAADAIN